jgi:hypothetical protein
LQTGKQERHHGSLCGRREWARAQYTTVCGKWYDEDHCLG